MNDIFSNGPENVPINFHSCDDISITPVNESGELDIFVQEPGVVSINLGGSQGNCKVLYDTMAHWDAKPNLIGKAGYIYIYSDWGTAPDGRKIAGFKVGDGETLLSDIIFSDQMYADHINDMIRHVTQEERNSWNNKVTCTYVQELERIIFSK